MSGAPPLTVLHVSFPSTNISRDVSYFEGVLAGQKVEAAGFETSTLIVKLCIGDSLFSPSPIYRVDNWM